MIASSLSNQRPVAGARVAVISSLGWRGIIPTEMKYRVALNPIDLLSHDYSVGRELVGGGICMEFIPQLSGVRIFWMSPCERGVTERVRGYNHVVNLIPCTRGEA